MPFKDFSFLLEGNNLMRLFQALILVIQISALSLILGLIGGTVMGVLRTLPNKIIRFFLRIYVEIFRVVPLLVLLFAGSYLIPEATGTKISNFTVSVLVFTFWIISEVSEIIRNSLTNVAKIQIESAQAIGLSRIQIYRYILFPQAFSSALPQIINLVTRVIKSSSFLMMIGVVELIKVGTQIIENYTISVPSAPLIVYTLILLLYFLICYPLTLVASRLEHKLAQRGKQ